MAMEYPHHYLADSALPPMRVPLLRHLVETYLSETNKTAGVWSELRDDQLEFAPHRRSSTVRQILLHQILSERRFFAETGWKAGQLAGQNLLEVGSGAGRFTRVVLQRTGATLYSVDF